MFFRYSNGIEYTAPLLVSKSKDAVTYYTNYDKKPEIPETPETPAENENNNTTTPSTDTPSSSQVTGTNQITGQQ